MNIDVDNIKAIISGAYQLHAAMAFGSKGNEQLVLMLDKIKLIYQLHPADKIRFNFSVIIGINSTPTNTVISSLGNTQRYQSINDISHVIRDCKKTSLIVENCLTVLLKFIQMIKRSIYKT